MSPHRFIVTALLLAGCASSTIAASARRTAELLAVSRTTADPTPLQQLQALRDAESGPMRDALDTVIAALRQVDSDDAVERERGLLTLTDGIRRVSQLAPGEFAIQRAYVNVLAVGSELAAAPQDRARLEQEWKSAAHAIVETFPAEAVAWYLHANARVEEEDPFAPGRALVRCLQLDPSHADCRAMWRRMSVRASLRSCAGPDVAGVTLREVRRDPAGALEHQSERWTLVGEPIVSPSDLVAASEVPPPEPGEYVEGPAVSVTLSAAASERFARETARLASMPEGFLAMYAGDRVIALPRVMSAITGARVQATLSIDHACRRSQRPDWPMGLPREMPGPE